MRGRDASIANRSMRLSASLLGVLLPALAAAQGAPRPGVDPGPWDNDVHLYRAWPDGSSERLAVFERSGVPSLVRLSDGRLMAAHSRAFTEYKVSRFRARA